MKMKTLNDMFKEVYQGKLEELIPEAFYDYYFNFEKMLAINKYFGTERKLILKNDLLQFEDSSAILNKKAQKQYKEWLFDKEMKEILTEEK